MRENFNAKIDADERRLSAKYIGREIVWYGDRDQMIVIPVENVEGMWGNIYYPEKLEQLVNLIKNSEERVELACSYGVGSVVNLTEIIEHQQSIREDSFEVDYENLERPYSIGDDEMDAYMGCDDIEDCEFYTYAEDDVVQLMNKFRFGVARGKISADELKRMRQELDADEESLEMFSEFVEIELYLAEAVKNKEGDLGKFTVQLRDGHHRFQAAKQVGERVVCINLVKDDLPKFKGYYKLVSEL